MFSLGAASSALKNAFFPFTPSPRGWLNAKSEFGIGFAKAFITYTSVGRFVAQKRISVKNWSSPFRLRDNKMIRLS
jgi:hypothetical protein